MGRRNIGDTSWGCAIVGGDSGSLEGSGLVRLKLKRLARPDR